MIMSLSPLQRILPLNGRTNRQAPLLVRALAGVFFLFANSGIVAADAPYQGFGATTPGGAGKPIVHVTNLNDTGPGSLRTALSAGDRTVVFDVAGEIVMSDEINVRGSFVTIDGFTAPPPGITLRNFGLRILGSNGAHDIIARGIRIRDAGQDGVWVADAAYNIVIDHFSVHNSFDGNIDITRSGTHNVTVQWSILAKPMGEEKNMLLAFKHSRVTLHHNIFVDSAQRNPQSTYDDSADRTMDTGTTLDMRNNLIWNWRGGYGSRIRYGTKANVVQNFYAADGGDAGDALIVCKGLTTDSQCYDDPTNVARAYVSGNVSADGVALNGRGTEPAPFEFAPVDIQEPCLAAYQVLADAGVRPLDLIDAQHLGSINLPPCLGTLPAQLDFSAPSGGPNPPAQTLTVEDPSGHNLTWTASVPVGSWVALGATSGTTPTDLSLSANVSGLPEGTYQDIITLKSSSAKNSPLTVPVTLKVGPPGDTAMLVVSKIGTGTGSVTSTPAGIDCGANCTASYAKGTPVTLTPTAGANAKFQGWQGDADCLDGVVTMDAGHACQASFALSAADLAVTGVTAPTSAALGSIITITDTTKNRGTDPALSSKTNFYLSTDKILDSTDLLIGGRSVIALPPSAVSKMSTLVTIPLDTPPGTYQLIVMSDAENLVPESNESNNAYTRTIAIGPDLTVYSFSAPSTIKAGTTVSVTDTIKNWSGGGPAGSSTTKFYLSTDNVLDAGDVFLGSRAVLAIDAGTTNKGATGITIPGNTPPGSYRLIAVADGDNAVAEKNETNNIRTRSVTIN